MSTLSIASNFAHHFGRQPTWVASAPGRVNLIGEHVDYNDGWVLPIAIDRRTWIAAAPRTDSTIRLYSTHAGALDVSADVGASDGDATSSLPIWARYVVGALRRCRDATAGGGESTLPVGLDVFIDSSVPLGGGLSSSAALTVATATLVEKAVNHTLPPMAKALLCQQVEHEDAQVPCGIMDPFVVTLAKDRHAMLLDCRSQAVEHIPIDDDGITILVANTMVSHALNDGAYAHRREQCRLAAEHLGVTSLRDIADASAPKQSSLKQSRTDQSGADQSSTVQSSADQARAIQSLAASCGQTVACRARHVIGEIQRTVQASRAMAASDWRELGALMNASHASLRDDYAVSCEELDLMVSLTHELGGESVLGSRMTGGGFGGCTVSLVDRGEVSLLAKRLAEAYRARTNRSPDIFVAYPSGGCG